MLVLITCKFDGNPIKELGRSRIHNIISIWETIVAQGQVTQKQIVQSGPKSNPAKILHLSSLTARLKKIQSKMKVLSCP